MCIRDSKGEVKEAQALQYEADRIIYKMCEAHGNLYACLLYTSDIPHRRLGQG